MDLVDGVHIFSSTINARPRIQSTRYKYTVAKHVGKDENTAER